MHECAAGLAALKVEYDVAKNPGMFGVLAALTAEQLIEQVLTWAQFADWVCSAVG